MRTVPDHARHPQSVSGISAAMLLGALMLTSVVDGLEMSDAATAAAVPEVRISRSQRAICEECGVIASSRRMPRWEGDTTVAANAQYEVTVRMRDGSTRTFIEASSVHWRSGERIILIESAGKSIN
jgi:hypothetical protein